MQQCGADARLGGLQWFQSSLELSPECNSSRFASSSQHSRFQSSLELSPECNHPNPHSQTAVSGFNPHSSFRPSATEKRQWRRPSSSMFQSSLELSPECNPLPADQVWGGSCVSILTRAFARVQRRQTMEPLTPEEVSILTRAFARVQHHLAGLGKAVAVSILTRAFARVQRPPSSRTCSARFQSSLELSPECNTRP